MSCELKLMRSGVQFLPGAGLFSSSFQSYFVINKSSVLNQVPQRGGKVFLAMLLGAKKLNTPKMDLKKIY